jgi:threonylcarbamoyladenosine tRNA methylthiotransferase MtaB
VGIFEGAEMKVHVITFGCRSNQCDSRWLEESLVKAGCEIVEEVHQADALIVNTCTVTAEGKGKVNRLSEGAVEKTLTQSL